MQEYWLNDVQGDVVTLLATSRWTLAGFFACRTRVADVPSTLTTRDNRPIVLVESCLSPPPALQI